MSIVIQRKVETYVKDLGDTKLPGQLIINPNPNFIPDEVIVKQISYACISVNATSLVGIVSCNMIDDMILGSFINSSCFIAPNTRFFLNKSVQNTYSLNFTSISGASINPAVFVGDFAITLEYVKYA